MRSAASSVTQHFDEVAGSWIERYRDRPSFRHRLVAVGAVVRGVVAGYDTPVVLDFGGGAGVFSLVASEAADWVLCLDPSPAMVGSGPAHKSAAVDVVRRAGFVPRPERVHRMVGNLDALDGAAASAFDVIMVIAVLEYLAQPAETLAALARSLRPGGRLVLTVPSERSLYRRLEEIVGSLGAGVGAVIGSERLRSRAYAVTRPHGNRVVWWPGADAGGLLLERMLPLALAAAGPMSHIKPTEVVVLRKRS